jgi:hypothetical protein
VKLDKAYVELRGGCIYVYLDSGWPPKMPPIVRACHRRAGQLFEFFARHGLGHVGAGVVEVPAEWAPCAAALAIMHYVAEFNETIAYDLCTDTPDAVRALIVDAVRWSRPEEGPAVAPRYYMKLAAAVKEIVEVWRESGRI